LSFLTQSRLVTGFATRVTGHVSVVEYTIPEQHEFVAQIFGWIRFVNVIQLHIFTF
jgi:hypothetical protein